MTAPQVDMLLRMLVAAGLGEVIGIEREPAGRGAGMRTHCVVALGAAIFTLAGAYGVADASGAANVDPSRVAAQVAAGVGFIGAGAILRHGSSVQGVTTAATVWLAAAVGVMVSAGGLGPAAVATGIALLGLVLLRTTKPYVHRFAHRHALLELSYARGHGTLGPVLRELEAAGARSDQIVVEDDHSDVSLPGVRSVRIGVAHVRRATVDELVAVLCERPELRSIAIDGTPVSATKNS